MKKNIIFIMIYLFVVSIAEAYSIYDVPPIPTSEYIPGYITPSTDEIFIGEECIEMPLNKIILVHYKGKHCAVKFNKFWHEKDENGKFLKYAAYDVYYQKDGSGDFSRSNVQYKKELASFLPKKGGHYFARQPGKPLIECGSLDVSWDYQGFLCVSPYGRQRGEYGIELAPTPWETISEVNIHDPHVRWFKYDEARKGKTMPIKELWENGKSKDIK